MGEVFAELEAVVFGNTAPLDRSLGRARDSLGRFVKGAGTSGGQAGSAFQRAFAAAAAARGQGGGGILSALRPALAAVGPLAAGAARAVSGVFGRAFSAVGGLANRAAGALFAPFSNVFSKLGTLWANMPFVVAGAGAAGLGFAVKEAGDLESSMIDIRKVTGYSEADMAKLGEGIKALATDSNLAGVSLGDILKIVEAGGRLGVGEQGVGPLLDYAKAMAQVSVSMDDIPIDRASEAMGQILNVFGLGADKARNFASVVDALADSTTASSDGIFDVTQRMSGAATAIKMTLPQTAALATAVLDMGDRAQMAGSALQRIMITMAKDPEQFAKAVGMTTEEFARLTAADPQEALKRTLSALSGMEGAARFTGLDELGVDGVMAQQVVLGLTQRIDALGKLTTVANHEMETGAHILDSVAMNTKKTWAQLTLLYNNIQLTAAELGGNFLPILKAGATAFGELAADVGKYLKENQGALSGWAATVAEKISYVGLLWQEWPTFMGLARDAIAEFASDFTTMFQRLAQDIKTLAEYMGEVISTALSNALTKMAHDLGDNPMTAALAVAIPGLNQAVKAGASSGVKKMPDMPALENPFSQFGKIDDQARKARINAGLDKLAQARAARDAAAAGRSSMGVGMLAAGVSPPGGTGPPTPAGTAGGAFGGILGQSTGSAPPPGGGFGTRAISGFLDVLKGAAGFVGEVGQEVVSQVGQGALGFLEGMRAEMPETPELKPAELTSLEEMFGKVQLAALGGPDPQKEQVDLMQKFVEGQNKMVDKMEELLGEAFPAVLS